MAKDVGPVYQLNDDGEEAIGGGQMDHWAMPGMTTGLSERERAAITAKANPDGLQSFDLDADYGLNSGALGAFVCFWVLFVLTIVLIISGVGTQIIGLPDRMGLMLMVVWVMLCGATLILSRGALRGIRMTGGVQPGAGFAMFAMLGTITLLIVCIVPVGSFIVSAEYREQLKTVFGIG